MVSARPSELLRRRFVLPIVGAPFDGFEPYLAQRYADARPVSWGILISNHEEGDTREAFYRLLREYVAQSEEIIVSPYQVTLELDNLFDKIESHPAMTIDEYSVTRMKSYIDGYIEAYFDGYAALAAKQHLDGRDPSWWPNISFKSPTHKQMYGSLLSYRPTYHGVPIDTFKLFLITYYSEEPTLEDWSKILFKHEQNEAIRTFFRLIREYAEVWKSKNSGSL